MTLTSLSGPGRIIWAMRLASLGFRAHSGWSAVVAVAGPHTAPILLERTRIELADAAIHGSKQPFHAAEELPLPAAEALVRRCEQRTLEMAREGLEAMLQRLGKRGFRASVCGLLQASGRPIPELPAILSSHAMIHTAEGEFFRNALGNAAENLGLAVSRVKERDLMERCEAALGVPANELQVTVNEMGRAFGRPWRQDEKFSTLAAWLALAGS
jgi:hypothetical protein